MFGFLLQQVRASLEQWCRPDRVKGLFKKGYIVYIIAFFFLSISPKVFAGDKSSIKDARIIPLTEDRSFVNVSLLHQQAKHNWDQSVNEINQLLRDLPNQTNYNELLQDVFAHAGTNSIVFNQNVTQLTGTLTREGLHIPFELRSNEELKGAAAAYASKGHTGTERIYVNADWVNKLEHKDLLKRVLIEEIGHAIDHYLNGELDSPGDEGELFSLFLFGSKLSSEANYILANQDDIGVLLIEGNILHVEFAIGGTTTGSLTEDQTSTTGTLTLSGSTTAFDPNITGTINYGTASINTQTGVWTYNLTNTLIAVQALNVGGTLTDNFTVTGLKNNGTVDATQAITITITGANDAPLNSVPAGQTVNEDVSLVFSSANSNLISVSDIDNTSLTVTLTATNGTVSLSGTTGLTFTTGDGTSDASMTFSGTTSAINTALAGMSFLGTSNFNGSASVRIQTSDGSLSADNTVSITVTSINDAPSGTDNILTILEDGSKTFSSADFGFSDVDGNTLLAIKISSLPTLGTLKLSGVDVSVGTTIAVADIPLLVYAPVANANGTSYSSFTFQVQDNGGTTNGGVDLDPTPNTITFNVTAVNDAPIINANGVSVLTDFVREISFPIEQPRNAIQLMASNVTNLSDLDNTSFSEVKVQIRSSWIINGIEEKLIVKNGATLQEIPLASGNPTYTITLGASTYTASWVETTITSNLFRVITFTKVGNMTLAEAEELLDALYYINTATSSSTPALETNTRRTFELYVTDTGGVISNSSEVVVTLGNGTKIDLDPDDTGTFNRTISYTEDASPVKIAATGTTNTTNLPKLYEAANYTLVSGPTGSGEFTFNNGAWTYNPVAYSGPALTSGQSHTFTVNYNWSSTTPTGLSGQHSFTIIVTNSSGTLVATSNRPFSTASGVISGTLAPSVDRLGIGLDQRLFVNTGNEFIVISGATNHTQFVGGQSTPPSADGRININATPSSSLGSQTGTYGTFTYSGVSYRYEFVEITPSLNRVFFTKNTGQGIGGTLTYEEAEALIDAYHYLNTSQSPTGATRSINFGVFSEGLGNSPSTATVNLLSVNDAPSGADKTVKVFVNGSYTFKTADFGFSDADGNSLHAVIITSLPSNGALKIDGVAVTLGSNNTILVAELSKLVYTPATDGSGASYASFTFQVQDNGGTSNGGVDLSTGNTVTTSVTLTVDAIANQTYTGSALTPSLVVKEGASSLVLGTDYTISYSNNTNVGTATVTINGAGNYVGASAIKTFSIVPDVPSKIVITNNTNNQSAVVGNTVSVAPSVRVTDQFDNPISGVEVGFAVATGGGSITGATATTNGSGEASVGSWTLGTTAGFNTLTATISGSSPAISTTFTATGLADVATKFAVVSLDPINPVQGVAHGVLKVQIQDQYGNRVAATSETKFSVSLKINGVDKVVGTDFDRFDGTNVLPMEGTFAVGTSEAEVNFLRFKTATKTTSPPLNVTATLTVTGQTGMTLTSATSAAFQVIEGKIYRPTPLSNGNWTSVQWQESTDGGVNYVNTTLTSSDFLTTDIVIIPSGTTITLAGTSNSPYSVSLYSLIIEGTLDLATNGSLTLKHTDGDIADYNIHVHGTFKNSGGTFVNEGQGAGFLVDVHGGTYWHDRDGGEIPQAYWGNSHGGNPQPSLLKVTGITNTAITGGLNQSFQRLEWDNASQNVSQTLHGAVTVRNSLEIKSGTLGIGLNGLTIEGTISVTNGWLQGAFGATVFMNGTGDMRFGPDASHQFIDALHLNNASGLTINSNLTVRDVLTLNEGALTISGIGNELTFSGANAIARSNGYIKGDLRRVFPSTASAPFSYTFPTGTSEGYAPIKLNLTQGNIPANTGILAKTVVEANVSSRPSGSGLASDKQSLRYWSLSPSSSLSGITYGVELEAPASEFTGLSVENLAVKKLSSSTWKIPSSTSRSTSGGRTTITVTGFTDFSEFYIGEPVATKLAFVQQPSNTAYGSFISPAVTVEIQDASGARVTSSTASVSIAIDNNPGTGNLIDNATTTTVSAVDGLATFSNLSIDNIGNGYTLKATSSGLTEIASSAFNITGKQLTISNPTLTTSKIYDGNKTASVSPGTLSGIEGSDNVTVSAVATYDTETVGTGKTITVVYTLGGTDATKYTAPQNYVVNNGEITKATPTATLSVSNSPVTYNGSAQSATVVISASSVPGSVSNIKYNGSPTAPTSAGTFAVTADFVPTDGTNYTTLTGLSAGNFVISKAATTTTVTLSGTTFTYTGSAIEPASVTVTGAGGLSLTPTASYANNTNVGTATASYSYAGDSNYEASSDSKTFAITKATATVTLGSLSQTYDGAPKSATSTTSPSGLSVTYTYNTSSTAPTNAGSYTVVGTINDSNYEGSATGTLVIAKASTTTTVTLSGTTFTYTGSAIEPASVTVTGAGGLSLTPTASYANNTNVGTATASYSYAGDSNYEASSDSKTFAITQATSTVTVKANTTSSFTYTGSAQGPGVSDFTFTGSTGTQSVSYAGTGTTSYGPSSTAPSNVGTYEVVATSADDANYTGASSSAFSFSITKATSTVTVKANTTSSFTYTGSAQGPGVSDFTFTGSTGTQSVSYTGTGTTSYGPSSTAPTNVGTYKVVATLASDANYAGATSSDYAFSIIPRTLTITNSSTYSVNENTDFSQTLTSSDPDGTNSVTFSITGGTDQALFSISNGQLILASKNYESPNDSDNNNSYSVEVTATYATTTTDSKTITVSVTNLDETPPVFTSGTTASINENVSGGTTVYTAAATDPSTDGGPSNPVTYTLSGTDAASFTLGSGVVSINSSPDYETKNSYSFIITATDAANNATPQTITLSITNVNDAPILSSTRNSKTVLEKASAAKLFTTGDVTITDVDSPNFNEGGISITGLDAEDVLSISTVLNHTSGAIWRAGSYVMLGNGTSSDQIATISGGAGVPLRITFTSASVTSSVAEDIIEAITFFNNSSSPTLSRTLSITVSDAKVGIGFTGVESNALSFTVSITPSNDAPIITLDATKTVVENETASILTPTATVQDADSPNLNGGVLTVSGLDAEDIISISTSTNNTSGAIWRSGTDLKLGTGGASSTIGTIAGGTGSTFTITFNSTAATPAVVENVLRSLTFYNNDDTPTASRPLTVTLSDGLATSQSHTIVVNVTAVNDAPTVSLGISSKTVAENAAASFLVQDGATAMTATVGDIDSPDFNGGGFTITGLNSADEISFSTTINHTAGAIWRSGSDLKLGVDGLSSTTIGTISGGVGNTIRVIFNSSSVTPSVAQNVLRAFTFFNNADNPTTSRTLTLSLEDGDGDISLSQTLTVNITPSNDRPVVSNSATALTVSLSGASKNLPSGAVGQLLSVYLPSSKVSDPDGTVNTDLGIAITAISAASQSDVKDVHYSNNNGSTWTKVPAVSATNPFLIANSPTTRIYFELSGNVGASINSILVYHVWDKTLGTNLSSSTTATNLGTSLSSDQITINATFLSSGSAPTNTLPASYAGTEDTSLKLSGLQITDSDAGSNTQTIKLSVPSGTGTITATGDANVTVSGSGTNSIILTGTLTNLNTFLSTSASEPVYVPFANLNGTVAFTMETTDNTGLRASNSINISLTAVNDAPDLDMNGTSNGQDGLVSFAEGGGAVKIAPLTIVTDIDSDNLTAATITLTNRPNGSSEVLAVSGTYTGITSINYDSNTGILSASGTATKATYESLFRNVTYNNSSANPDLSLRTVTVTVTDGTAVSTARKVLISLTNVNSAPVVSIPLVDQSITAGLPFSYTANAASFTDPEGDALTYSATLADGSALPSWLKFNPSNLNFNGVSKDVGTWNVKVTATDPAGASVSDIFVISAIANPNIVSISFPKSYRLIDSDPAPNQYIDFYGIETSSFKTDVGPIVGTNFTFYQNTSAGAFNGNNIPGFFRYIDASGNVQEIAGYATRPIKTGSNIEGVYFVTDADGDKNTTNGNTAYLLVINESYFKNSSTYGTSSDPIDSALNGYLFSPAFSITGGSASEGGSISFTVTRSASTDAATVNYLTNLTATNTASANDFTATSGTLSFAKGVSQATITVQTTADAIFESNETFTVLLTNPSTGSKIDVESAIGTITNDDAAPEFRISNAGTIEGGTIVFTVTRTSDAQVQQTVNYSTTINGTSTASVDDFTTVNGTLTFALGETAKTISVATSQDDVLEEDETFSLELNNPTGGAIVSTTLGSAIGTIENDEGVVVYSVNNVQQLEGSKLLFTITRSGDVQSTQSVNWATSLVTGNTASSTDYQTNSGTVTFQQGNLSKTFEVESVSDNIFEGDETFTVSLSGLTAIGTGEVTRISTYQGSAIGTIQNDDASPVFSIANASGIEGSNIQFTVSRFTDAEQPQTVDYQTTILGSNTATFADFSSVSNTLTFAPGELSKTFTVSIIDDGITEDDENFTVLLSNATGGASVSGTNGSATGTILSIGVATQLAIATQPSATAQSGIAFVQQPAIQLKNSSGVNVPQAGVEITVALGSGANTLGGTLTATTDANGLATFTDLKITGLVGDRTLTFTSGTLTSVTSNTITVSAGAVDASASTVTASPSTGVTADGTATSTVTVTLKDANNNVISGKTVTLTDNSSTSTITTVSGTTNASGVATFTVTNTVAEMVTYSAKGDNIDITQTASVTFVVGAVDASASTVTASPSTGVTANGTATSTVTVTLKDANNNVISGKTVTLTDNSSTSTITTVSGTTNASGVATFTVTNTVAEMVTYSAKGDNVDITQTAQVTFIPGVAYVLSSTVTADPISITANGTSTSTISIQLKDANGNNTSNLGGQVLTLLTSKGTLEGILTTSGSGLYTQTLKSSTTVETATLTAKLDASTVTDNATVDFIAGVANYANTTVTADPTSIIANGTSTSTISIQLKDANGNNTSDLGGKTLTLLTDKGSLIGSLTTSGSGLYTQTLKSSTTAETATLTAKLDATAVTDNATVEFTAGVANYANTTVTADPTSITANGTSTSTISIQLKDANGNNTSNLGGQVLTLLTSKGTLEGILTTSGSGLYTQTLKSSTTVETATLTAKLDANTVTDNATVDFIAGVANYANTTVTADPTSIIANGTSTSTISIQLKDANGNNTSDLGGKTLTLLTDKGTLEGSLTTSGSGLYTQTLKSSTTAETATLTAKLDATAVTDNATVDFTVGTASQIAIYAGNNQSATVNTSVTTAPSVIVKDANNNVVSGVSVTFAVATGGGSITGGSATTDVNGIATLGSWTLGTTAGTNTLTATSTGLSGSPLTFTATGTADVPNKIAIVSLNPTAPVRGIPRTEITVQLQDTYGNPTTTNVDVPFILTSNKTFEQYQNNTYTSLVSSPGGTIVAGQSDKKVEFIRFTQSTRLENNGVSYPAVANVTATDTRTTPLLTSVQSSNFVISDGTIWLPYFRAGSFSANSVPTNSNIGNWTEVDWETSKDGGNTYFTLSAGASIPAEFSNDEIIQIPQGANLKLNGDISLYNMEVNGQLEIPTAKTLTLKHTAFDVTSAGVKVTGTFKNSGGTFTNENNSNAILFDGGTYLHARDGGAIPTATWQTLGSTISNVSITGVTSNAITGLNQEFQNFEWNNTGQTVAQSLTGNTSVSGLFNLAYGKLNIGSNQLTLGGTIQHGTSGFMEGTETSELVVNGTGQMKFDSSNQLLKSLSLNNASGLILNSSLLVKDNLTLTSGVLKLADTILELKYKGANQIQRTDGYVVGKLRRIYPNNVVNPVFDYPIGSDEGYAPITLNFTQANISANTEILGYTELGNIQTRHPGSGFKSNKQMQRYWVLTPNTNLGTFEYNVAMDNLPISEMSGMTFDNLVVRKLSESGTPSSKNWKKPNTNTKTVSNNSHKITAAGFKDFSEFYIGEPLIKTFQLRGPDDVIAGQTSGNITLTVVDELGDPVPVSEETVFTLSSDFPTTATMPATLTLAAGQSSGTFTYSNTVSGSHVLTATWSSGVAQLSGISKTHVIAVLPENANRLSFVTQPQSAAVGETLGGIQVEIVDQYNNRVSSSAAITLAIDTNPGSGTLSGTATVNAVSGLATFTGLSIDKIGTGYILDATSPVILSKLSSTFNITKKQLTSSDPTIQKVKEYDGNRTALVTPGTLTGVLSGHSVTLNATATYDTKDVATNKVITVVYTLTGADAVNYSAPADFVINDGQITPKALTVTADNQTVSYGTAISTVTNAGTYQVSGFIFGESASVVSGSVTYTTNYTTTTAPSTSGITITPVVSGLSATNYSFTAANGTITVEKASSTISVTGSTSFTYSGLAQGPASVTKTGSIGAVTYSYKGTGTTTYGPSSTAPTNAGTYEVNATLAADANYNEKTSTAYAFTIEKAIITITADAQTVNYGTAVSSVTSAGSYQASGFVNGENGSVISGTVTYSTTYTATTAAGTAGVTITPNVSGLSALNYSFTPSNGSITIAESGSNIIVTGLDTFTYTGLAQGPNTSSKTGSSGAVTYTYEGTGSTTYGPSTSAPSNAGTYKVVATLASDANYEGAISPNFEFTINKAPLKVIALDNDKVFGNEDPELTVEYDGFVNSETESVLDHSGFVIQRVTGEDVNTYEITASGYRSSNYEITYEPGIFTISAKSLRGDVFAIASLSATVDPISDKVYTGLPQTPKPVVKDGEITLVENTDYTLSYSDNILAGTATVMITGIGNYADFITKGFTIKKATLTVTADNQNVNYGSAVSAVTGAGTYQITGFVNGETANVISGTVTYSTTYTSSTAANTAGITITPIVTALSASNYEFNPVNGSITIVEAGSSVTVTGSTSFTYNGSAQGPNTSTKTGSSGSVTYAYSGTGSTSYGPSSTAPSNAGTYKVIATLAADANFASATSPEYTFTINKVALTVTADNQTVDYGTAVNTVTGAGTYKLTGFVNNETANVISGIVTYSTNFTSTTPSGATGIIITPIVTGLSATNYSFVAANGSISVGDIAPPTIITKNITVYLDANGQVSITAADVDNGTTDAGGVASRTISKDLFTCTDVGINTIVFTATDNYGNSASVNVTVTVLNTYPDTDGDGTKDNCDNDDDNDGITDTAEIALGLDPLNPDTDGDGVLDGREQSSGTNYFDGCDYLPADRTLTPSAAWNELDCDGDGTANGRDANPLDFCVGGVKGVVPALNSAIYNKYFRDADCDGDGIPNHVETNGSGFALDFDGDGTPNYMDGDSDNDGIPDQVEAGQYPRTPAHSDADAWANYQDLDSDNDGISDQEEGVSDTDGDGLPNYLDIDSDGDGIFDAWEAIDVFAANRDDNYDGQVDKNGQFIDNNQNGWADISEGQKATDTDGDGAADYKDLDSDNDCIPDAVEKTSDMDKDNRPNYRDTDSDGDGIPDQVEAGNCSNPVDTDKDGTPDYLDLDSDNDGIPDSLEAGANPANPADTDKDGLPDYRDLDSDNDGISDVVEAGSNPNNPFDTDGDGTPDFRDLDSDNDGISDKIEAGADPTNPVDTDKDGTPDFRDLDSDNDGISDKIEAGADPTNPVDTDKDGLPDFRDLDSDNDGISDKIEAGADPTNPVDTDKDGTPDFRDLDSDNDGISDKIEAGADPTNPVDTDKDGTPDYQDLDSDNDGIPDVIEAGADPTNPADTDKDGLPDYRDLDSDNDGISDKIEAGADPTNPVDTDKDGTPDFRDLDSDNDGIPDKIEGTVDTDKDGIADFRDVDSDNDGISDKIEAGVDPNNPVDTDQDGTPDFRDLDSDNDGILDQIEGTVDTDQDGTPDFRDLDSDNDGYLDKIEGNVDTDKDGIPDFRDLDSDNDGILDKVENDIDFGGMPDCDGDGIDNRIDPDQCPTFTTQGLSPNNDGINDVLIIPGIKATKNHFTVFNRWGNIVYEVNDYQNNWGGETNQSGVLLSEDNKLPDGTYYYVIDYYGVKPTVGTYVYINRQMK